MRTRPLRHHRRRPDGPRVRVRRRALDAPRRHRRAAGDRPRLRRQPGRARLVRAARARAAARRPTGATCSTTPRSRPSTARSPTTCTPSCTSAILEAGQHLLGEKPFGIDIDANKRIMAAVASHPELLVRCSSELPFFPGGQAVARWMAERARGPRPRGPEPVPALQRPRPEQADQLEAPGRVQRRLRLHGRPRDARAASAAALGADAAHGPRRAVGRGDRAARPRRRDGAVRHAGQRRPALRGQRLPDADRDQADRTGRDEHVGDRDRRHRGLDRVHHEDAQDAAHDDLRAGRPAGMAGGGPRLPVRLPDDHRRHLRVRLRRRDPADVGRLPRRARPRRRHAGPFRCATPEEAAATHRMFTAALESDRNGTVVRL